VAAAEGQAPRGEAAVAVAIVPAEGEAVGGDFADGDRLVAVVVDVGAAPVAVAPAAPAAAAARRERERAAPRRAAGERGVRGGRGGVQEREALVEAVAAGRALRPHEVAAGVERQRHGPRRRPHRQVHQVLVRHDPAAAGAEPRAHGVRGGQEPAAAVRVRPGSARHSPHEVGPREAAAGVGVREQQRRHDAAGAGAGHRHRAHGERDHQYQQRHELLLLHHTSL